MDLFHCLGNLACFSDLFTILMINGNNMFIYVLNNSGGIRSSLHDVDFNIPTISCISFLFIVSNSSKISPLTKINMWFVFTKVPAIHMSIGFDLVYGK